MPLAFSAYHWLGLLALVYKSELFSFLPASSLQRILFVEVCSICNEYALNTLCLECTILWELYVLVFIVFYSMRVSCFWVVRAHIWPYSLKCSIGCSLSSQTSTECCIKWALSPGHWKFCLSPKSLSNMLAVCPGHQFFTWSSYEKHLRIALNKRDSHDMLGLTPDLGLHSWGTETSLQQRVHGVRGTGIPLIITDPRGVYVPRLIYLYHHTEHPRFTWPGPPVVTEGTPRDCANALEQTSSTVCVSLLLYSIASHICGRQCNHICNQTCNHHFYCHVLWHFMALLPLCHKNQSQWDWI